MAQEIISFEKLCELYEGTYSKEEGGWFGQPKEVCEVDSLDDYYALVQALRNLKEKGFIPEVPWVAKYVFGEGTYEYSSETWLDKNGLSSSVTVERIVASIDVLSEWAREEGISEDEYFEMIDRFLEEGRNLAKNISPPWLKDYTECETYLDPDYDVYVAKCEADIPEPLVNPDSLETAINSLADAVEQAEI